MAEESYIKCQHKYSHADINTRQRNATAKVLNVRLTLAEVLCLKFFYIKHLTRLLLLCNLY